MSEFEDQVRAQRQARPDEAAERAATERIQAAADEFLIGMRALGIAGEDWATQWPGTAGWAISPTLRLEADGRWLRDPGDGGGTLHDQAAGLIAALARIFLTTRETATPEAVARAQETRALARRINDVADDFAIGKGRFAAVEHRDLDARGRPAPVVALDTWLRRHKRRWRISADERGEISVEELEG